ncbi:MAG TPA: metalloregulator ArsR/SmtB family transcription factor [Streptosporangiaceae bacterium]|nr:metalloregulator ArsR/SmtB family transcription factor [Streptosporangiaceae bacterium]
MGAYEENGLGALGALGDRTRQAIVERLVNGPCSVGDLASELPVSRPAVSQHLRVLKDAGLVVDEAAGTRRVYRINPDGVLAIRAYLDRMWGHALASFEAAAIRAAQDGGSDPEPAGTLDEQGGQT